MKKSKAYRNMKIHETSGYNYKATPAIVLKGQWLRELGFDIGGYISVSCENGRIVITPDAEWTALKRSHLSRRRQSFCRRDWHQKRKSCMPSS